MSGLKNGFDPNTCLVSPKFWVQKEKNCWVQIWFGLKKFWIQKIFGIKKKIEFQKIWVKNKFGPKNWSLKNLRSNKVFVNKEISFKILVKKYSKRNINLGISRVKKKIVPKKVLVDKILTEKVKKQSYLVQKVLIRKCFESKIFVSMDDFGRRFLHKNDIEEKFDTMVWKN